MTAHSSSVLIVPAAERNKHTAMVARQTTRKTDRWSEAHIDAMGEQSFPASDPPSWNMGVADPAAWRD